MPAPMTTARAARGSGLIALDISAVRAPDIQLDFGVALATDLDPLVVPRVHPTVDGDLEQAVHERRADLVAVDGLGQVDAPPERPVAALADVDADVFALLRVIRALA